MKRAIAHNLIKVGQSLILVLAMLFSCHSVLAQGWEVTFGGVNEDQGTLILQTQDQGFIAVGYSESFGLDGDFDIYIVRTDVDGTLVWETSYDEGYVERANDIMQLPDGGFLLVGKANDADGTNPGTPSQVYLLRIDARGNLEWTRRFDNDGLSQSGNKIIRTSDGGYAIIGQTETTPGGDTDILLLKLDSEIEEEWRVTHGTVYPDEGKGIVEVPNGYTFVANVKNGQAFNDDDVAIYRVNEVGNVTSLKVYNDGQENNEDVNDLLKTQDGNIMLVGSSRNFNRAYIIKSDFNGDTLWTREIAVGPADNTLRALVELEDGSVIATGFTSLSESTNPGILILKLSPDGETIWERSVGEEFSDWRFGEDIVITNDGDIVIVGTRSQSSIFINDLSIIKLDGEGNYFTNLLEGKVFWSQDGCNPYEDGDQALRDWLVQVESEDGTRFIGTTDEEGYYKIPVGMGSFTVRILPQNDAWDVCSPSSFPVDFADNTYDTLFYNFPVRIAEETCPYLSVNLSSGPLMACTQVNYLVEYCNDGSGIAPDAYVEVFLDEELTFVSASVDTTLETDNSIIVRLGDLLPLACGSFTITVDVVCDAQDLQTVVVSANAYPNEPCYVDPNWNMSSIEVSGRCEGQNIIFTAKNVGSAPSDGTQELVIIEDHIVLLEVPETVPPLGPGQEVELPEGGIPANELGSTYRLIVEQVEGHPGNNYPTVAVEGCIQEGGESYTTGEVAQFPENDQDPYVDIDVQEILNTFGTANRLIGHPKGYQDSVITTNTDIEYTLLFANTGSDTLDRLVIRDTLPAELDLSSLSVGPASHPYVFELYNGSILKITFNDLNLLPADGSSLEADTRGFVKFTLSQKPNLPIGTVIENRAAVYFDYVAPELTNAIRYSVACEDFITSDCLTVALNEPPVREGINIRIQPNPFNSTTQIVVEECECNALELVIRDATGREMRREQFSTNTITLQRNNLPAGLYFIELYTENQIVQTGKLLVQ